MYETSRCVNWLRRATLLGVVALLVPAVGQAQGTFCDLDISDNEGSFVWGNTVHLVGRAGAGTNTGQFHLINGNIPEQDVDHDGYTTTCNLTNIVIPDFLRVDLVNTEDPGIAIPRQNVFITGLPRTLPMGSLARVTIRVELPAGTPAGRYIGSIGVDDATAPNTLGPNNEVRGTDVIFIEVIVEADPDVSLLQSESNAPLDSLVLQGRAGGRASGVFRLANAGNAGLEDVRITATDLRSESAVGLVIPARNVTFSQDVISGLLLGDTARITVNVQIPRGILGGRYRGSIIVQGQGVSSREVPLIVIVTSTRGIQFANNPVREGVAQIAFNGDPGTRYSVGIFDMSGLMVHVESGAVYAGAGGTVTAPGSGADFAASVLWPLTNDRGEAVASGLYLVVVESIVNGKRQQARDRLMVIR